MTAQPSSAIPSTLNGLPVYGTGIWISYKVDIQTRLRTFFYSVARLLHIMHRPPHDLLEEFKGLKNEKTGFSDVAAYYYFLANLYKSATTWSIDRDRWKVAAISTYKATDGFEHESLVVEVECKGEKVYLRIERRRSKSRAGTSDDSDPSPDNPDNNRAAPTDSLSKTAHDAITFSKTSKNLVKKGEECVEILRFSEGKGLSLPQLAILACCVNKRGQLYYILEENCYWFAHVLIETVKLIEPDFKLETRSKRKMGEWKNLLPTIKPTLEVIKEAKVEYEKLWDEFNTEIYNSVNNKDSEIYQQALKRVEEERFMREMAEHNAAEKEEENKRLKAQLAALTANGVKYPPAFLSL